MYHHQDVPLISDAEKAEVFDREQEMTGIAVDNTERELFLKCAFRTGDISTVWVNPILVCDLFWHLKRLLRDQPENAGSAFLLATDVGAATFGGVSSPEPD